MPTRRQKARKWIPQAMATHYEWVYFDTGRLRDGIEWVALVPSKFGTYHTTICIMYPCQRRSRETYHELRESVSGSHSEALLLLYRDTVQLAHFLMVELSYLPDKGMLSVKLYINVVKSVINVSNMHMRRSHNGVRNGGNDYLRKSQCLIKIYTLNPAGMEIVEPCLSCKKETSAIITEIYYRMSRNMH